LRLPSCPAAAAPAAAAVAVQAVVQAAVQTDHWLHGENNSLVLACVLPSIREGTFSYTLATHSVWMFLKGL